MSQVMGSAINKTIGVGYKQNKKKKKITSSSFRSERLEQATKNTPKFNFLNGFSNWSKPRKTHKPISRLCSDTLLICGSVVNRVSLLVGFLFFGMGQLELKVPLSWRTFPWLLWWQIEGVLGFCPHWFVVSWGDQRNMEFVKRKNLSVKNDFVSVPSGWE